MDTIDELIANLRRAKEEVRQLESAFRLAQAKCSHSFSRERESDGHRTQYIYTCHKCYLTTYELPPNGSVE